MRIKNNKGIGLIELLIVIAVAAMTAPLVSWVFVNSVRSYNSYNKYINQHYTVIDVTRRICKDVEEALAYKVGYDTDNEVSGLALCIPEDTDGDGANDRFSIRIWKLSNGRLEFKSCIRDDIDNTEINALFTDIDGYNEVLSGLDTALAGEEPNRYIPTRFEYMSINKRVLLSIKPAALNTGASQNRNVNGPVSTEFCVRYKDNLDDI